MMPYLSLAIWVPIVAGLAVLAVGRDRDAAAARWIALTGAIAGLVVTLPLWLHFDTGTSDMQFVEFADWIPRFDIHYFLGVDGISMLFVLLNSLMTLVVVWSAWEVIQVRVAQYMAAFLIQSGLINGAFCALDGILFYMFFEAMLIPMYIIIGAWGGPNRVYAAVKFFLYTLLGSLLMLVALIYLYDVSDTFSIVEWYHVPLSLRVQVLLFIAFFLSFAVKVPMWPVHTWLPDAHVEAPTGGSVILAAITLKIGAYGFVRFILPIVPDASRYLSGFVIALVARRDRLHRFRRADAGRHEEADRVFVHLAHGVRHARLLPVQPARHGGRPRPDDLARLRVGGDVPLRRRDVRPHAQPADRGLRRRRQHDAEVRGLHDAVRDGQFRASRRRPGSSASSW